MGNGQFQVPQHVSNEWTQTYKTNKKYLRNKITLEEFEFMVLQKLKESHDISFLIERSIYSLPKTPKIIILNDQKGELFILVQDYDLYLTQHLPKVVLVTDLLELMRQAFMVILCLLKKYGHFGISENMVGLNRNMEILAWINQQKQKNQIQFPLQKSQNSEKLMISQIVGIFKKYARYCFNYQQLYTSKNIQSVLKQLNKIITKRKIEMAANYTELKKRGEGFRRALSPQTSFGGFRQVQAKYPKIEENGSKPTKRNNVPNFLKRMGKKRDKFLDVFSHKRTETIEQAQKQFLSKEKRIFDSRVNKNREKCSSKSLNKVKSLKSSISKDRNSNFSGGQISKISFPNSNYTEKTYDCFTQSGSSSSFFMKKRELQDLKTEKSSTKTWKFQSFKQQHAKDSSQQSPTFTENGYKPWEVSGFVCRFPAPQTTKTHRKSQNLMEYNLKVPLLTMCNTSSSNCINEPSRQTNPVIQEQSRNLSKTLQDQVNDFFSNHSKSPRFTLQALPESNQLTEQFSKVIDF